MSIKKQEVVVCDGCGHVIEEEDPRTEITVLGKKGKKKILHACDEDCLDNTIFDNIDGFKITIDNR